MRVLVLTTDFPPHTHGGYELQCAAFVHELRARGHVVRVLAGAGPACAGDHDVHRVLPRFDVRPRSVDALEAWRGERRSRELLAAHEEDFAPDVAALWRLGELSMSLPARVRVPAVGMVCDPWMLDGPRRDPWAARHPPPAFGRVRWLFVSPELREQVAAGGVDVAGCEVVPWGVDVAAFPLAARQPWRRRLLCAGRLSPLKGADVAVAAAARLPGHTLDVAGAGPLEPELRAAAGAGVRFLGPLARPALARAYRRADVLLFGVRWQEPFGAVPLEAMASGTPVVATGTGGSAAFLRHEETALLVPAGDAAAMAAAVRRLAGDEGLRARLREAGRAEAERFPAGRSHAAVIAALEEAARPAGTRAAGR